MVSKHTEREREREQSWICTLCSLEACLSYSLPRLTEKVSQADHRVRHTHMRPVVWRGVVHQYAGYDLINTRARAAQLESNTRWTNTKRCARRAPIAYRFGLGHVHAACLRMWVGVQRVTYETASAVE